jgi:hypothetical protein
MTLVQVPILRDAATSALSIPKVRATANRVSTLRVTEQHHDSHPPSTTEHDNGNNTSRSTRQPRKPSPGLAARLKALGFGKETNRRQKSASPAVTESIGRIPEDHIRQLDFVHRTNSTKSHIQRRGRAWSGSSNTTTRQAPQIVGDSSTGFSVDVPTSNADDISTGFLNDDTRILEVRARRNSSVAALVDPAGGIDEEAEMDEQKYRLPDHINGNGTKSMLGTKQAHLEREESVPDYYDEPPIPISKDGSQDESPDESIPGGFSTDVQSYFNPFGLQRAGSIYTLSRVSFANQLAQLTSLQLPDAESLSSRVSSIRTSQAAARALTGAADQIRSWISKASEVLGGLDADDDVEWAAAGGREGLAEVDNAISRFEELINVYVSAIEELQSRDDISNVPSEELKTVVTQVETILAEWEMVRKTLTDVKSQVEIAMEWEELWNVVLGDIGNEMDTLSRLVFEMEEKRHKSLTGEAGGDGVDIGELETIVEETPQASSRSHTKNRFSITASFPMSQHSPHTPAMAQDDSSLLALFARMQPLRASLDFLPMRLSTFHARADESFPTACAELESRREGLESSWKNLEKDADSLRRELGEDRWVLVFRGAGRQAQKLYESVERSFTKLKEAIDTGGHLNNPSAIGKKIESYEAKKINYGPAIDRVLAIIEKGVKDRLTVNGEVVRLHSDMQNKWDALKSQMVDFDALLEEMQADKRNQQLRDSISSLMSNDRSTVGSMNDTPGSSPASSVIMSNLNGGLEDQTTPVKNGKPRSSSYLPQPSRHISSPSIGSSQLPRKGQAARLSTYGNLAGTASPSPSARGGSATPTGNRLPRPGFSSNKSDRPPWNSSVKTSDGSIGHNFKPLSLTTPSPHGRPSPSLTNSAHSISIQTPLSKESKIPLRSPIGSEGVSSPASETPSKAPLSASRLPYRNRISSPGPYSQQSLSSPPSRPRALQNQASTPNLASRRASMQPLQSGNASPARPALAGGTAGGGRSTSSLATSRRTSLLPQPQTRGRRDSSVTGRESPHAVAGAASAMRRGNSQTSVDSKGNEKPRWR